MSELNDGGFAFPCERIGVGMDGEPMKYRESGMSLRDYFAAKELSKKDSLDIFDGPRNYDMLADHCYRIADAMLRAREHQK